jgi:phosphate transport system protein
MDRRIFSRAVSGDLLLLWGLALCLILSTGAIAQSPEDFVGPETCLDCHDDMAVNIPGIQPRLKSEHSPAIFGDSLQALGVKAQIMLRQSLESLMNMDTAGARRVLVADDEVDLDYKNFIGVLKKELMADPSHSEKVFAWLLAAKSVERVADLATNIAEDTIYTVEGEIVRHGQN